MKRKQLLCYVTIMFGICLIPFGGMIWKDSQESVENRTLAKAPVLKTEEGWNVNFLADAGACFEDHFAYRQEMVTADALIRGRIFGVSSEDSVIEGTDGWLYYMDSLDDYLGRNVMSDRAVYNVAHTLKMMQDYIKGTGRKFIFTVAPNKNSLYNENMPYYYSVRENTVRNIDKLQKALEKETVNYVNLYQVFEAQDEVLYHKRDSHWNNKGAAMAAEALLFALEMEHITYEDAEYEVRTDFEGDLDHMLYPNAITLEEEIYFTEHFAYEYMGEVESNFDPEIQTVNPEKMGSLLMYRDSFGNALLPFLAEEFGNARFSRGVPYYLDDMFFCGADTVIVERAERFIPDMSQNPPVMQVPLVLLNYEDSTFVEEEEAELQNSFAGEMQNFSAEKGGNAAGTGENMQTAEIPATCDITDEGLYLKISGVIDEAYMQRNSQIYLRLDGEFAYEAFPVTVDLEGATSDYGYTVYLLKEDLEGETGRVELFVSDGTGIQKIMETEVLLKGSEADVKN